MQQRTEGDPQPRAREELGPSVHEPASNHVHGPGRGASYSQTFRWDGSLDASLRHLEPEASSYVMPGFLIYG